MVDLPLNLRHLLCCCAFVFAGVFPSLGDDLIIESRSGGKNYERYGEITGAWRDSNTPVLFAKSEADGLTPQGEIGSRTSILPKTPGTDTADLLAAARFTPEFPAPFRCFVYVTWPKGGNATPVRYVVRHARGTDTVSLSQNGFGFGEPDNANTWNLLGEFEFGPGKEHYVELRLLSDVRPVDTNTPGRVYTDGVRFSAAPLPPAISNALPSQSTPSVASAPAPTVRIDWGDSVAEALAAGRQQGKSIFVFFYSPTSDHLTRYEEEVFGQEEVRNVLRSRFVCVRINMQQESDLAGRMRAYKAGTINLYDSSGNALGQISDRITGEELITWLNRLSK